MNHYLDDLFINLSFDYMKTDFRYLSRFKDGRWDEGQLIKNDEICIKDSSTSLHYAQQAFEGLKAYRRLDGGIQLFRPDENAKRFIASCRRLSMPEVSIEKFINSVIQVVRANDRFVPPRESNATLYIRPVIIGVGENIGITAAKEYLFIIFSVPVGTYYGLSPANFIVTNFDRAAPNGTGNVKVGANYANTILPRQLAMAAGYADCIYLDPLTHTKIEETGGANFFAISHDNRLVTPRSPSIIQGITVYSLMFIAQYYLNMRAELTDIFINQLDGYKEAGVCGTATVITPVGGIFYNDHLNIFYSETKAGPIITQLYNILTSIQFGDIIGPSEWIYEVL